jgi:DNA polymerase III epsilon subunit-like protein
MMQYQPMLFNGYTDDPLKEVIVFDLETTGLSREDEIIQIAATKLVGGQLSRKTYAAGLDIGPEQPRTSYREFYKSGLDPDGSGQASSRPTRPKADYWMNG